MNKAIATAVVAGCHGLSNAVRKLLGVSPSTGALTVSNGKPPVAHTITYGPELCADPTLDTIAGWTLNTGGTGWSHTGGMLVKAAVGGWQTCALALPTVESGAEYLVEIDMRQDGPDSGGGVYVFMDGAGAFATEGVYSEIAPPLTLTKYRCVVVATDTSTRLLLQGIGPALTVEYLSVKKIINNAARLDFKTGNRTLSLRNSPVGTSLGMGAGSGSWSDVNGVNRIVAIGTNVLGAADGPYANSNIGIGVNVLAHMRSGTSNIGMGEGILSALQTGNSNIVLGYLAGFAWDASDNNVAIGVSAGSYNPANVRVRSAADSIFIGRQSRAAGSGQTNQIAIGYNANGAGSNTATWGGPAITNHYFAGNINVAGSTLGLRTARTPATAADPGTAGDICWDASYVYVCVAANTWKRSPLATW